MLAQIDTLEYAESLKAAGLTTKQAEGHAKALHQALTGAVDTHLATKEDLAILRADIKVLRWMLTVIGAAVVLPLIKTIAGG